MEGVVMTIPVNEDLGVASTAAQTQAHLSPLVAGMSLPVVAGVALEAAEASSHYWASVAEVPGYVHSIAPAWEEAQAQVGGKRRAGAEVVGQAARHAFCPDQRL